MMTVRRSKRTITTITETVTKRAANGTLQSSKSKRTKVEVTAQPPILPSDPAVALPEEEAAVIAKNPELQHEVEEAEHKAEEEGVLLHPPLTFSYQDARDHLIGCDGRFKPLMDAFVCKPFEGQQTEPFNPFRNLATSILGQQISWLAARSVTHKFVRYWHPHLPEKLEQGQSTPTALFPTPAQICDLKEPIATMRSCGLSQRKAEYILELAQRFHDGRLDAKKLWGMSDEQVKTTLIECRGIGPWTIDMFSIFSLKRPDILAPGDLGVQKNLCKWYGADPESGIQITPLKRKLAATEESSPSSNVPSTPVRGKKAAQDAYPTPSSPLTTPAQNGASALDQLASIGGTFKMPPTSNNLTPATLRARLNGKKIKGNYLTPQEMEELMEPWRPFRSVATWYLWQMSDLQDE